MRNKKAKAIRKMVKPFIKAHELNSCARKVRKVATENNKPLASISDGFILSTTNEFLKDKNAVVGSISDNKAKQIARIRMHKVAEELQKQYDDEVHN